MLLLYDVDWFNQGLNILLTADEHRIGRSVEDSRFQIESNAVSGNHCRIFRKRVDDEDVDNGCTPVLVKDTRLCNVKCICFLIYVLFWYCSI